MFGSDKNMKEKVTKPSMDVGTLIGEKTTVTGDIEFSGGLHLDGAHKGNIVSQIDDTSAVLTITDKGRVEGLVRVPHVIVDGVLVGDIHSNQKLELLANAKIHGNVYYRLIVIEVGAEINGSMVHEDAPQKHLAGPEAAVEDDVAQKKVKSGDS